MSGKQACFAEDCEASYYPAALDATGYHCPSCGERSIQCPVCEMIVSFDALFDENHCPWCDTHRLDLGDAVREAADHLEVAQS